MTLKLKHLLLILFTLCALSTEAQTLERAKKLFLEREYSKAIPTFKAELTKRPKDASLNYWYGACLFETGETNTAREHLLFAYAKEVSGAYPYTIQYHTAESRYEDAKKIVERATKKKFTAADKARLDQAIEQLNTHIRWARNATPIEVIDSVILFKDHFLEAYKLSHELGSIHLIAELIEMKSESGMTAFMNEREDRIFFSDKNETQRQTLNSIDKIGDQWDNKKELPGGVNSDGNNIMPYLMADGITIYFASDRAGGAGGYDLYVSRKNLTTDTYLVPENLGFPFNSPANDYLYVYDELKEIGWIASDRRCNPNQVIIYTFLLPRSPEKVDMIAAPNGYSRLTLSSIAATQIADSNYEPLRTLAHSKSGLNEKNKKPTINFIINDHNTYTKVEQFSNEKARQLFDTYLKTTKQHETDRENLAALRNEYTEASKERKKGLRAPILKLEDQISTQKETLKQQQREIRNLELQTILKPQNN